MLCFFSFTQRHNCTRRDSVPIPTCIIVVIKERRGSWRWASQRGVGVGLLLGHPRRARPWPTICSKLPSHACTHSIYGASLPRGARRTGAVARAYSSEMHALMLTHGVGWHRTYGSYRVTSGSTIEGASVLRRTTHTVGTRRTWRPGAQATRRRRRRPALRLQTCCGPMVIETGTRECIWSRRSGRRKETTRFSPRSLPRFVARWSTWRLGFIVKKRFL